MIIVISDRYLPILIELMAIHQKIVLLSAFITALYLIVFEANVWNNYYVTFDAISVLLPVCDIITTDSDFVLAGVHVWRICLWNVNYSKISVDLIVAYEFGLLLAELVQRAVNSVKLYILILNLQII